MFKKVIHIFLAAAVCISLSACGGEVQRADGEQQSVQTDSSSDEHISDTAFSGAQDAVCAVIVKINPRFKLFLNEECQIVRVEYLNEDAKQALSDVNVLSLPIDEGILILLDVLCAKGYAKKKFIQITWAVQVAENSEFEPFAVITGFENAIDEFSLKNDISVSCSITSFDDAVLQSDQQIVDGSRLPADMTAETDSNGNVISYTSTDSRGNKVVYNANWQKMYVYECSDDGYREIYYNENGEITKDTSFGNDGSQTSHFYYASGNRKQDYTLFANGEYCDRYYSESGDLIKHIHRFNHTSGAYMIDYDTDGNGYTDYQYVYDTDGTVWYNEFDSNGNQIPGTQKRVQ